MSFPQMKVGDRVTIDHVRSVKPNPRYRWWKWWEPRTIVVVGPSIFTVTHTA